MNENCTACGACAEAVSAEIPNPWNYNMNRMKAAYLPHAMAYPQCYVLDASILGTPEAEKAKAACKYGAIDLDMKEETVTLKAGAVIWATGWQPYDAAKIQPYGYGRFANVVTSLEFERLADPRGPTGGRIVRPSDGKELRRRLRDQRARRQPIRAKFHRRRAARDPGGESVCQGGTMKSAAYVCGGCGLGERLDTARLASIAQTEGKMDLAREHPFLCSAEGVATIRADIENDGVTHVAIAACSQRSKAEAFQFPSVAMARANLREGVIWIQPAGDDARETAQEMADDYVRMACAELKSMKVPAGNPAVGRNKRILVVGGGISGLTAAREASERATRSCSSKRSGRWAISPRCASRRIRCLYSRIALFCGTCPTCAFRIAARRHDGGRTHRRDDPRSRTRRKRHDCGVGSRRMRLNSRPRRDAD